ncbi:DUF1254 domain-containing protein [Streptomyces achromogenes]|uniref:DUF1254 domain-containing protein n=1 Tax=Streptomyces achromogenes TaxID=67255 RepID=UPI003676823E
MTSPRDHRHVLTSLTFNGGYPTEATARTLQDELFFQRAVQTYLWALPVVVQAPPNLQGLVDDFWHRPLQGLTVDGVEYRGDIGLPGPDRGKGGTYLIVPHDHEPGHGDEYDGYFVYRSRTNGIFFLLRGFFSSVDDLSPGVASIESVRIHPLHGEAEPMRFAHASDIPVNALYPRDLSFFRTLDAFIQADRIDQVDPYMHGVLAAVGIRKGHTFDPPSDQRELLDLAARTGWRMAKTIVIGFDREPDALWWDDRRWVAHAKTTQDDFWRTLLDEEFRDRVTGHTDVNAKAHMFANHYSISTGMISSVVGLGAKYAGATTSGASPATAPS